MAPKINLKDKVDDGEIDLSMSDLQDVPVKEIAQITKVHSLDLSNNHLALLPKNFTTLTNFVKIDLSKNQLKELPDSFGNLVKLKQLDLYKNQLQHLPLSFSKLKALRWLDLKDNPLVPAVKEVAGLCLDQKQCQLCAKNIVAFYANLEEKVVMEREAREKQRQKDKMAFEQANQKLKQQEKKAKKKEKNKKTEQNQTIEKSAPAKNEKIQNKSQTAKKNKSCCIVWSFAKFIVSLGILISIILFGLTSINCKNTQFVTREVSILYRNYLEVTPDFMKDFSVSLANYIVRLHEYTGGFIKSIGEWILHAHENPNVQNFVKNVYVGLNSTLYAVKGYYESFFAKN